MNLFWMPINIGDYHAKTTHLTTLEDGAYFRLMMHYWTNGSLPQHEEGIRRITGLNAREWKASKEVLKAMFDGDWRRHAELDEKRQQAIEKSKVNSANAKRSHVHRRKIALHLNERSDSQLKAEQEVEPESNQHQQRASASQQQPTQLPDAALSHPVCFQNGVHVHELADYLCDIAGLPSNEGEKAIVREWCAKSWDPRLICNVVEGVLGRSSGNAPRTLKYFEPAIQEVYSRFGPTDPVEKPLN